MRLAIAFLFVISWTDRCSGYDYSSSCSRTYRSNRMQTSPDVPCDLNKQIYCVTPGTNYPWQAIRSFIRENQGLMKRMYGDERHITVLKAELENFIEDGDVEKVKKPSEFTEDTFTKAKIKYTKSQGRAMKVKPHFRPIQDKNKLHENETLSVKPLEHNVNSTKPKEDYNETEITNNETINDDKGISYKTKLESIANIELNDLEPNIISLETVIKQTIESNSLYQNYFNDSSTETLRIIPKNDTERNITASTEKTYGTDSTTETQLDETTTVNKEGWKPVSANASTLPPTLLFSVHEKIDRVDTVIASDKKDEINQKPAYPERPSVIKLGGENACETRRTLEAPFWANNTKNELLALVNMYPFEQYIHMETCVHEKKQMYCREGCRCEQQYRFHRLLAYDPRNECRGIFSDWFKFPACCVCKCYDVPVEFRARSPRVLHPQYDDDIKRVIYEDVARDWYSTSLDEEADDLF